MITEAEMHSYNPDIFKERLKYLMDQNGYNANSLGTELYVKDLVQVKSHPQYYTSDDEIKKNKIGSIVKKIRDHLNPEKTILQAEFIYAYCEIFNCSADYLLGFSDISSHDVDVKSICEKTGLSQQAVENLIDDPQLESLYSIWSVLLESEFRFNILSCWISLYGLYDNLQLTLGNLKAIENVLDNNATSTDSQVIDLLKVQWGTIDKQQKKNIDEFNGTVFKLYSTIAEIIEDFLYEESQKNNTRKIYQSKALEHYSKYATFIEEPEESSFKHNDVNDILRERYGLKKPGSNIESLIQQRVIE